VVDDRAGWYRGPVPDSHESDSFRFVPLTEALVDPDYDAVMTSRELLRRWSNSRWPTMDFTVAENESDLREHRLEHEQGVAYTFSVLERSGPRVAGCIYIRAVLDALTTRRIVPGDDFPVLPGAAAVRGWVRADEPGELLDELVSTTTTWLSGGSWTLPEVWWQANWRTPEQLAACDRIGLARDVVLDGPDGVRWHLRSR
jgi:hypothetical protein